MSNTIKNQENILEKLKIESLNPMQEEARLAILSGKDLILLSPTGTGKTLAFLLPVIEELEEDCSEVQALVLVPARELAIQIESVLREMGTGYKTNAIYGGRPGTSDKTDLKHPPAILIGTPGRVADHLRRETFSSEKIKTVVLDEFDKSLEIGFEAEMKEIMSLLPNVKKRILTSASAKLEIPPFIGLKRPATISYLESGKSQLKIKVVKCSSKDKLAALLGLLCHVGNQPGIVFCNFKDSIEDISAYLKRKGIGHGLFHGGMEQMDRERALIKFRNGTHQLLLATDLAARGIDIPELKFIVHFQLPNRSNEFLHRNGRTARMNRDGTAYLMEWDNEDFPLYISELPEGTCREERIKKSPLPEPSRWKTMYISGGRRDKISKGDIAGMLHKTGKLNADQIGAIEVKQDFSFVAVDKSKIDRAIDLTNNTKLKTKKVRVSEVL